MFTLPGLSRLPAGPPVRKPASLPVRKLAGSVVQHSGLPAVPLSRLPAFSPSGLPAFRPSSSKKGTVPTPNPSPPVQSLFLLSGRPTPQLGTWNLELGTASLPSGGRQSARPLIRRSAVPLSGRPPVRRSGSPAVRPCRVPTPQPGTWNLELGTAFLPSGLPAFRRSGRPSADEGPLRHKEH